MVLFLGFRFVLGLSWLSGGLQGSLEVFIFVGEGGGRSVRFVLGFMVVWGLWVVREVGVGRFHLWSHQRRTYGDQDCLPSVGFSE